MPPHPHSYYSHPCDKKKTGLIGTGNLLPLFQGPVPDAYMLVVDASDGGQGSYVTFMSYKLQRSVFKLELYSFSQFLAFNPLKSSLNTY